MKRFGVGVLTLATKLGLKFGPKLLKLVKALKIGKAGLAGASMASYAYLFSWQFAAMVMVLLFVHESGHIWAMRKCGVKTKGIYFIPFLGAAAVADNQFPSRKAEVFIAIMGPIWGLALSLVAAGAYAMTANPLFAAAASWMAMINLFNLLPINPLDGGRIMKSIAFFGSFACRINIPGGRRLGGRYHSLYRRTGIVCLFASYWLLGAGNGIPEVLWS